MRALAKATTAFCPPERSRSATAQWEILSCRRCAVITADVSPWTLTLRLFGKQSDGT